MRNANEPVRRIAPGTTGGVLETIADGLSLVLERPRLLLLPLIVDLVLWLGLQVSMQPLVTSTADFLERSGAEDADLAAQNLRTLGDRLQASDALGAFLPSVFSGVPIDTFLYMLVAFLAPSGAFGIDKSTIVDAWSEGFAGVMTPGSAGTVFLIMLACLFGGTLLLALYKVPLARAVRGDTSSRLMPEIGKAWLHFMGYLVLLAAVMVAALVPLFVASLVAMILGLNLLFVVTMALLIFGGIASIYTLFMVDAMLLHRAGPIRAFGASRSVAREYFSQTARLALTSLLVLMGALHLWSSMAGSMPGIVIALLANAFLGTGLAVASMLFYSDRFRLMRARERSSRR